MWSSRRPGRQDPPPGRDRPRRCRAFSRRTPGRPSSRPAMSAPPAPELKTITINMGPQHPSTHGVLRLIIELDGETVVSLKPVMGYFHTGMEKIIESKTYTKAITVTDRMDYLSPLGNNMWYGGAGEKILGTEVPDRAKTL